MKQLFCMPTSPISDESHKQTTTRRNTLKLAGGAATTVVLATGPTTAQSLFDLTIDGPAEAVAGDEVTISLEAQAAQSQISAFQIAPDEQSDHINDYEDLTVTTTAETQIEEPDFIAYSELQEEVTVEWTGSIPETAQPDETVTLAGDALDDPQNRQLFSHTVTVTDEQSEDSQTNEGEGDNTTSESESSESTPGFGIMSGISAIGATGYILKRRLSGDSE